MNWLLIVSLAYCSILVIAWAYFHISSRMRERKNNRVRCIARSPERRKQLYRYWGVRP